MTSAALLFSSLSPELPQGGFDQLPLLETDQ
jgi:hypothetical protein